MDDKPKTFPAFSRPAPPMHCIPPDRSHGPPSVPGMYEQPWRHYPPYEGHPAEQTRTSTALPPLSSHGYPVIPNRELPQLPPDGPYSRQGSPMGPKHTPTEAHSSFRGPMNGTAHEPAPHSAPPEYRSRMSFTSQEPPSNGDAPPPIPPHSIPPAPYSTPVPPMSHTPAPQEKATQLLLDRLQSFQDAILDRFDRLDQLNTEHGNNFNSILAKIDAKSASKEPRKPAVPQLAKKDILDIQDSKAKDENIATMQEQIPEPSETTTEQVVPSGEDGELSIPVEHTTAAHKLLLWPSIRNLLRPREYDEDYVMKLEEKRGLIRVYGRGEGDETSEDHGMCSPPTTLSTSFNESQPYYPASPPNGPWGVYVNQPQIKLENKGLDEDGMLTADPDMVRRYHKSYMKHMHQLHPFLDQSDLENKVDHFIRMYCPLKGPVRSPGVLNNHLNDMPRGAKRKRSCENLQGVGCDAQSAAEQGSGRRIEKSIYNAIILLVLALGSICEANPVPGPVTDYQVDFRKETIPGPPTHGILSPAGSDSLPQSQGSGYVAENHTFASPSLIGNRQSGAEGHPISQDKNLDYIPGLAFYAYATQILGSLQGANRLPHVQAALLAGLYAGQLAHPFQSHGWIYQAARACQVLVRSYGIPSLFKQK
ncbi:unnamed protein product [Aspergillus oryzae]|nr:unnamed protein product [Aspergillus oryzae]